MRIVCHKGNSKPAADASPKAKAKYSKHRRRIQIS
jgi:hypothetical protein